MAESEKISRLPPERTSQHYSALRDTSLQLIGTLAAETWTDHNVHDPGITFAEAYIYALTDVAFRTQLPMRDLLRSGAKIAPPALPPAHHVLPCAPVTMADVRNVLLDHYLIKDAAISTIYSNDIAFYRDDSLSPPLTYSTGGERVRLQGLYEVLIEFQDVELNRNNYGLTVDYDGTIYTLDLALPHWDEAESAVFQEEVTIDNVTLLDEGDGIWRSLEETLTYFAQVQIDFTGTTGAGTQHVWLVLRIADALMNPAALVPNILAAAEVLIESNGTGSLIVSYAARVLDAHDGVEKIRRYLDTWRNLSEVPARIAVVRQQEIAVRARIEMNTAIDLELLVAKIFAAIDLKLSPPSQLNTLSELINLGLDATDIYQGPLLRHGFLQASSQDNDHATVAEEIYTSDILRIIMRQRGGDESDISRRETISGRDILAVSNLTLSNYVNNRLITKNARDCLRLVEVQRYRPRLSVAKSRLVLVRDDIEIPYDLLRVEELFQVMQNERNSAVINEIPTVIWPVQRGEDLPIDDYVPFQNELPRIYGVGEAALPDDAGTERKAQVLQTKGYLSLAEQFLADSTALLANINRFFSAAPDEDQSYFTKPVYELPGIQKLIKQFPAGGDWAAFIADPDNPYSQALRAGIEDETILIDRRNRMLDHLLARHGVQMLAWAQELHRLAYQELKNAGLSTTDFQTQLIARRLQVNTDLIAMKAEYLADVPQLNATRMQAFANAARWSNSIAIIAGDAAHIWQLVQDGNVVLQAATEAATRAEAYIAAEEAILLASQANFFGVLSRGGQQIFVLKNGPAISDTEIGSSVTGWPSVPEAQAHLDETAAGFSALTLNNSLTSFERIVAHQCGFNPRKRLRLLTSADVTEGFHLVEHILLRPQEPSDTFLAVPISNTEHASDPYSHRLSLVFPSGYARDFALPAENGPLEAVMPDRFRDQEARKYVQRVVELHCPAHILPKIYWVHQQLPGSVDNPGSFDIFEERYFAWLSTILTPGTAATALTNARSELIESLNLISNG